MLLCTDELLATQQIGDESLEVKEKKNENKNFKLSEYILERLLCVNRVYVKTSFIFIFSYLQQRSDCVYWYAARCRRSEYFNRNQRIRIYDFIELYIILLLLVLTYKL